MGDGAIDQLGAWPQSQRVRCLGCKLERWLREAPWICFVSALVAWAIEPSPWLECSLGDGVDAGAAAPKFIVVLYGVGSSSLGAEVVSFAGPRPRVSVVRRCCIGFWPVSLINHQTPIILYEKAELPVAQK